MTPSDQPDNLERVTLLISMLQENYAILEKHSSLNIPQRIKRVDSSLKQITAFFSQYEKELKQAHGPTGNLAITDLMDLKKNFENLRQSLVVDYHAIATSAQPAQASSVSTKARPIISPAPTNQPKVISPRVIKPVPLEKTSSFTYLGKILERFVKQKADFRGKWNRNKKYIYDVVLKGRGIEDEVSFEKYAPATAVLKSWLDLFHIHPMTVQHYPLPFAYQMPKPGQMHVTLNFSHEDLFSHWQSSSFNQNEHQMAEHPILGFLGDYLRGTQPDLAKLRQGEAVLLLGVKRYAQINPKDLYAERFERADHTTLDRCTEVIKKAIPGNILSITPLKVTEPRYGKVYSKEEISQIFVSLYTGFAVARQSAQFQRLVLNTGNWGCGAYGNNLKLITILQIFAALLAKVDDFIAFTFNDEEDKIFVEGKTAIETILTKYKDEGYVEVDKILTDIQDLRLTWKLKPIPVPPH